MAEAKTEIVDVRSYVQVLGMTWYSYKEKDNISIKISMVFLRAGSMTNAYTRGTGKSVKAALEDYCHQIAGKELEYREGGVEMIFTPPKNLGIDDSLIVPMKFRQGSYVDPWVNPVWEKP